MPRFRVSSLVCLLCVPLLAQTLRGAEPAEDVLKGKDLKRAGTTYVLPAEATLQKSLKEANTLYRQVAMAVMQERAFANGAVNQKAMIQELTQRRILLNRQLSQATTAQQNNQLVAMINEVTDNLNLLRQEEADPDAKDKLSAELSRRRGAFVEAVLALRQAVDETQAEYRTLADDPQVKEALATLNQKSKTKLTLGPSRAFLTNVKLLGRVEASVLSETVSLRKKGGIFWLDVTFNGKVTKEMAFDTGASDVVLPPDYAAAIGLKPSNSDPTVRAQIADGSIVEAKQMTIGSLRVGKFTIKDVRCIVMPPEKADAPPLLGGTFHKYFTYKFSPEAGTLLLTKVETPDEPSVTPAKAKSGRTTKARR